jgi:thiamine kinase-like enzyme
MTPPNATERQALEHTIAQVSRAVGVSSLEVAPLRGVQSLNNQILMLIRPDTGARYVLRLANPAAVQYLGVSRSEEQAAIMAAAQAGIGPEVIYFDAELGHLATPWIDALSYWQASDFRDPPSLARIVQLMARMHQITTLPGDAGSSFRRIEALLESMARLGLPMPSGIAGLRHRLEDIEAERRADLRFAIGLNHNDLWANNFLDDGKQLWLLDWEFAGRGDGWFDLATVSMAGAFEPSDELRLLEMCGRTLASDVRALRSAQWVVRLFEACWSAVMYQLAANKRDAAGRTFDFLSHSRTMFAKIAGEWDAWS